MDGVGLVMRAGEDRKSVVWNLSLTEIVRRMCADAGAGVTDEWSSRPFTLLIVL